MRSGYQITAMQEKRFDIGDVVLVLKDSSRGIVVGQSPQYLMVLFDSYMTIPIPKKAVYKTGIHIELDLIWNIVYSRHSN